jgi:uncharacterized protein (DUF169 family)
MPKTDYAIAAAELSSLLGFSVPPIAITFLAEDPVGVQPFGGSRPAPTADGRTGTVPAGCVYWMHAVERTFATTAADHGNCSVGSVTHGFKALGDVAGNADVRALLAAEWVRAEAASQLPTVSPPPRAVVYGPLAETPIEPDIVFLRVNGKQLMLLYDAWPDLRFEGKPQCHIIPLARETGEVAISTGCMLSRVRTGMSNNEVTCAVPARRLVELLERLRAARQADLHVAAYAAEDARRFA